jgi:heptosyltransferase-1
VSQLLLVKTSSLGDVVHSLPVVTDLLRVSPRARVDWVAERSFASIPALHPGVRSVIPCELRRWRRTWLSRTTRSEWRDFLARLRSTRYDAIIDTQGLLKSALIARLAHGRRYGLDWPSSREPLRLFYDRTFNVPWSMHAVERNRRLAAMALGYEPAGDPDYGIRCAPSDAPWLPRKPNAVLLHASSHARKLWPESSWIDLGQRLARHGYSLLLPWGSPDEQARAMRLTQQIPNSAVPPAMELVEVAAILAGAAAVVGVDTGLTHLAAALGVPTIGIYGATDPRATGLYARGGAFNRGGPGRFPSVDDVLDALRELVEVAANAGTHPGARLLQRHE